MLSFLAQSFFAHLPLNEFFSSLLSDRGVKKNTIIEVTHFLNSPLT